MEEELQYGIKRYLATDVTTALPRSLYVAPNPNPR